MSTRAPAGKHEGVLHPVLPQDPVTVLFEGFLSLPHNVATVNAEYCTTPQSTVKVGIDTLASFCVIIPPLYASITLFVPHDHLPTLCPIVLSYTVQFTTPFDTLR